MGRSILHRISEEQKKVAVYDERLKAYRIPKAPFSKKISGNELLSFLPLVTEFKTYFIRTPESWKCTTYNRDRQKVNLTKHLFFKYEVPQMFVNLFVRLDLSYSALRIWAIMLGQGQSLRDEIKGIFTVKELHFFLNGPSTSVCSNAWYAKCAAQKWPMNLTTKFINHVGEMFQFNPKSTSMLYWNNAIHFFSRYLTDLTEDTLEELLDYVRFQNNNNFSFEGRTLASVIRLSNEWHTGRNIDTKQFSKKKWDPMDVQEWSHYDKINELRWTVSQLLTDKQLVYESKIQKHCVWSYVDTCAKGRSRIFTLHSIDEKGDERKHITIEVDPTSKWIRQTRGKLNRPPNNLESIMIYKWASENGLVR